MKKQRKNLIYLIILVLFSIGQLVKYKIFNVDFNSLSFLIDQAIIYMIFIFNNLKLKDCKFLNNYINIILLILSLLMLLFASFNGIGFLMFFAFLILISIVCMNITQFKFELSLVISTTLLIMLFILIGLSNLLIYSPFILILIFLISLIYLIKNKKKTIDNIKSINTTSLIIFSLLFLVAILGGVGRYVHSWDEYSYWAYAAKVGIQEDSLYAVISKLGSTRGYPPVSTIWHYIVSVFTGYSEPNMYMGLSILTFIYIMPLFEKLKNQKIFEKLIFVIAVVFFPLLFNGSISYSLLYVDLLLGAMCGSALVISSQVKESKKSFVPVMLVLAAITLLKVNGFVFSLSILLLFYLQDLIKDKFSFKELFLKLKKYILPGIMIVILFVGWRLISNLDAIKSMSYEFNLLPDILKSDLALKIEPKFLLNFVSALISAIDEDIIYSFINIPLFAYLIIVGVGIYFFTSKKGDGKDIFKVLTPYAISYIAFYLLTALSLFVMFSQFEASNLASFGRYLAPINIAFMFLVLYKISSSKNIKIMNTVSIIIICLLGFSLTTFFITDIKERRDTVHISQTRQDIFSTINNNTKEDAKVYIINQEDTDSIMPLWYARYYCYPRMINSYPNGITWKIKTKSNTWDLQDWGLTIDTFQKHVIDYKFDYVYFYTNTNELTKKLVDSKVIDDKNDLKKYKLFKIEVIGKHNIKLRKVK